MKFLFSQLSYLFVDRQARRNLRGLLQYLAFLSVVIVAFSFAFQWLMLNEGKEHSWLTGLYWTLTVMTTLGFGDITFESDLGRAFSILVLLSGVVLLLIVLPFAFIRFFYAPWMEAQLRGRAPQQASPETRDHVIICQWHGIAEGIVARLRLLDIPYLVIEPDATAAAELHMDGVCVVRGEVDSKATYVNANVKRARAILADLSDPANANITLTVREVATEVPIIATVEHQESVDVLELAGATHVLPLKQRLGQQLANRANARHAEAHVIGEFKKLVIAEFPVHGTPLAGVKLRETGLREKSGVNVVGIWERGRFESARPDTLLTEWSVPIVMGTQAQIDALNRAVERFDVNDNPVIVIGGGKVGRSATTALKKKGVKVHLVERDLNEAALCMELADEVLVGEGAELTVLQRAGIDKAPSVLLTTNDDAVNIYLCIYCRRLNPDLRIISRVTFLRNVEAIHRAGADFILSYASLAEESVLALIQNRGLVFVGEGVGFFSLQVPKALAHKTLAESEIGTRTGLNIVALQHADKSIEPALPSTKLQPYSELWALGTPDQHREFRQTYD